MTASDGVASAARVLAESDAAARTVKLRYSGTVPPPPWPRHPALVTARGQLATVHDAIAAIAKRSPGVKLSVKAVAALDAAIAAVELETGRMLARDDAAPRVPALPGGGDLAVVALLVFLALDA